MNDALVTTKQNLLEPAGLSETELEQTLGRMLKHKLDYGDLYFENSTSESWVLENGIVKDATRSIDRGVGVRAISGEKTGFAYAEELILPALQSAADNARSIAKQGVSGQVQVWQQAKANALYEPVDPITNLSENERIDLLHKIDAHARKIDPRVQEVIVTLAGMQDQILIAASDGTFAADVRPLVRINCTVIVEQNGKREIASSGAGGRYDYQQLMKSDKPLKVAEEAVRQGLVNLEAIDAPAGTMQVVLGPGWPGVLLHEAIGHGLEGDFNRKGSSNYAGKMGEQVASKLCTVVDNGTLEQRRGSLNCDDEGTPTQCNTLIENGKLVNYMQDKLNARLMGVAPTGNGRRESYAHITMPRMTNTYMLAGEHDPKEIIASVDKGLYAVNFGGGQVDITSGKFVFSASEAYLIENGKVTAPVKGATLIGNGPEVLGQVSMVGNDLELDQGVGVCGKEGQSVPVGVGQPTLRIDGITVGGTQVG